MNLMRAHDSMKEYQRSHLGDVLSRSRGSRRAVYLAMLLMARVEDREFVCDESQSTIAMLAGVTQVTATKALRDLGVEGLIEIRPPRAPRDPWRKVLL